MSLLLLFAGGGPQVVLPVDYTVIDFYSTERRSFKAQARPVGVDDTFTSKKRETFKSKKRD